MDILMIVREVIFQLRNGRFYLSCSCSKRLLPDECIRT